MALELLQELESGVSGNYWRIGSVVVACTDDPIVTVYMELYLNREARQSGKSALKTQPQNMMLYQIDSTYDYDFRACIYNSIKQFPYWENAKDIFEFAEKYDNSPIANYVNINCDYNSSKTISFNAQDINNDPLTYVIVDQPANGTISQSNGVFTYTPNVGWDGTDIATYRANNGASLSNLAKLYLTVPQVAPRAFDFNLSSEFNGSNVVNFTATDPNNLTLTYVITSQPSNGNITANNGVFTYTPNNDWSGIDIAKFKANNGEFDSNEAIINITVISARPSVNDFNFVGNFNSGKIVNFTGTDPNNLPLTFSITQQPSNGSIDFLNGNLVFTPDNNWAGNDNAKFVANNGTYTSEEATLNISVTYPIPLVFPSNYQVNINSMVEFVFSGSDPANLPLQFTVTQNPVNGTILDNNDGTFTYKPNNDFFGNDELYFKANNGFEDSAETVINFEVVENV